MKQRISAVLLLPLLALTACATQQPPPEAPPAETIQREMGGMARDTTETAMERMMEMHARMMADSVIHRHMMADSEIHAMMREMMGDAQMQMGPMQPRDPAVHGQMMTRMRERMQAMTSEQRQTMMQRMRAAHQRMMADARVHERMMADPEMRRMMEHMAPMREGMQHGKRPMMRSPADSSAILAAAERFRDAIVAGDRTAAEAVLLPNAVILESGNTETRTEYLSHHFGSDSEFLKAVTRDPVTRAVWVAGDAAWISSTSRMHGTFRDREIDVDSAELLVLRNTPEGWRVAAVHWSSRPRQ